MVWPPWPNRDVLGFIMWRASSYLRVIAAAFCLLLALVSSGQDAEQASLQKQLLTVRDSSRVETLIQLGELLADENMGEAMGYDRAALGLAKKLGKPQLLARAHQRLGRLHLLVAAYDSAFFHYREAMALLRRVNNAQGLIAMHISLGNVSYRISAFNQSIGHYQQALHLSDSIKNYNHQATILNNLGLVYLSQNQFGKAEEVFRKALQLNFKQGKSAASTYNNLGDLFFRQQVWDSALLFFNKTLELDLEAGDKRGISGDYNNLGIVYKNQGNFEKALDYQQRSLAMNREMQSVMGIAGNLNNLGTIYKLQNNCEGAIQTYLESINLATKHNDRNIRLDALNNLADAYKQCKDFEKAFETLGAANALRDSIYNSENQRQFAKLEEKLAETEQSLELEQSKTKLAQEVAKRNTYIAGILIFMGLLVAGISVYFAAQRARNRYQLANLQSKALYLQMNPHFIFNAIGAISGFITQNQKKDAVSYLAKFAKLMRYTLERSKQSESTVHDEVDLLERYLLLEQLRFNGRFSYHVTIESGVNQATKIPSMLIQPFVENAINHGVVPSPKPGVISVVFTQHPVGIACTITDNGIGRAEAGKRATDSQAKHLNASQSINAKRIEVMNDLHRKRHAMQVEDLMDKAGNARGTRVTLIFDVNG